MVKAVPWHLGGAGSKAFYAHATTHSEEEQIATALKKTRDGTKNISDIIFMGKAIGIHKSAKGGGVTEDQHDQEPRAIRHTANNKYWAIPPTTAYIQSIIVTGDLQWIHKLITY